MRMKSDSQKLNLNHSSACNAVSKEMKKMFILVQFK